MPKYKYNENTIELVNEYINSCLDKKNELPTIEGLALALDVNDDTIVEWSKNYEEFAQVYRKLKMVQKTELINKGIYGDVKNIAMLIFLLKVNHGMVETSRIDQNININPIPIADVSTDDGVQEDK